MEQNLVLKTLQIVVKTYFSTMARSALSIIQRFHSSLAYAYGNRSEIKTGHTRYKFIRRICFSPPFVNGHKNGSKMVFRKFILNSETFTSCTENDWNTLFYHIQHSCTGSHFQTFIVFICCAGMIFFCARFNPWGDSP